MAFKPLSAALQERLNALQSPSLSPFKKLLGGSQEVTFEDFAASGELAAIPDLVPFALEGRGATKDNAWSAIAALLRQAAPLDFPVLDQAVRKTLTYEPSWRAITPAQIHRFSQEAQAPAKLGILSVHGSGFVREIAVHHLSRSFAGGEMGFLLLRLNDWVEAVRQRARAALQERMRPRYAAEFVDYLPLVLRLEDCGRAAHAGFVQGILDLLALPECEHALAQGLESADSLTRRACFRPVAGREATVPPKWRELVVTSRDPLLRQRGVEGWMRTAPLEELPSLWQRFGGDLALPIRRAALLVLVERLPALATAPLQGALLGSSAIMREFARFYLRQLAPAFSPRAFYRAQLEEHPGPAAFTALYGLAEVGGKEDFPLLRPYFDSPLVFLRKAALTAAGRLAPDEALPVLQAALASVQPGVSRAAQEALLPHVSKLPTAWLESLYQPHLPAHVRHNVFRLLLQSSKWDRLRSLLLACTDEDAVLAKKGRDGTTGWLYRYNINPAAPTPGQLQSARAALASAQSGLEPHTAREVSKLLESWRHLPL